MQRALFPQITKTCYDLCVRDIYRLLREAKNRGDPVLGQKAQYLLINYGLHDNAFLATHLIRAFASCGKLKESCQTFARVLNPNPHTWASIILALANCGESIRAIDMYFRMREWNRVIPNAYCYITVLKACVDVDALDVAKVIHSHIVHDVGFDEGSHHVVMQNVLIDMYVKLGNLSDALGVFRLSSFFSVISWTSILLGYAQLGFTVDAFQFYHEMLGKGIEPNDFTFVSILKACSSSIQGRLIFSDVIEQGLEKNMFIRNTFIDLCSKDGYLKDARYIFDHFPNRDVTTWTTLIDGYSQMGCIDDAIKLFQIMQCEVEPNHITYLNVLRLCSISKSMVLGKLVHMCLIEKGLDSDTLLGTALIDMYAKNGRFKDAHILFEYFPNRNMVTWTSIISGYAKHCDLKNALGCFHHMQKEGFKPNEAAFTSLLSCCGHLGLLHKGNDIFLSMMFDHGMKPTFEHYYCIADLLARSGCLFQAYFILHSMPCIGPHVVGLRSLLSHCKTHGNVEIAQEIFDPVYTEKVTSFLRSASDITTHYD